MENHESSWKGISANPKLSEENSSESSARTFSSEEMFEIKIRLVDKYIEDYNRIGDKIEKKCKDVDDLLNKIKLKIEDDDKIIKKHIEEKEKIISISSNIHDAILKIFSSLGLYGLILFLISPLIIIAILLIWGSDELKNSLLNIVGFWTGLLFFIGSLLSGGGIFMLTKINKEVKAKTDTQDNEIKSIKLDLIDIKNEIRNKYKD